MSAKVPAEFPNTNDALLSSVFVITLWDNFCNSLARARRCPGGVHSFVLLHLQCRRYLPDGEPQIGSKPICNTAMHPVDFSIRDDAVLALVRDGSLGGVWE
jgi:hypothetical protein